MTQLLLSPVEAEAAGVRQSSARLLERPEGERSCTASSTPCTRENDELDLVAHEGEDNGGAKHGAD